MATTDTSTLTQSRAEAKYVRLSARKARVVLDHIRGRSVPEARTILAFTPRAAAVDIEKVLRSAVANAESRMPSTATSSSSSPPTRTKAPRSSAGAPAPAAASTAFASARVISP